MIKNGWLQKRSHGAFSRWQSRYGEHHGSKLTLKHNNAAAGKSRSYEVSGSFRPNCPISEKTRQ